MRPPEFSDEAIVAAGMALQTEGTNITGFALRKKVGGGSPGRLIKVWKAHTEDETPSPVQDVEIPPDVAGEIADASKVLSAGIETLARAIYGKAIDEAKQEASAVIIAAEARREEAVFDLTEALKAVDDLKEQVEEAGAEITRLDDRNTEIESAQRKKEDELAAAREELKQALVKMDQLNAVSAERDQMRAEKDALKVQAEIDKAAQQEQRKRAAGEAHRLAERVEAAKASLRTARQEARSAREEAAGLHGQLEAMKKQNKDLLRMLGTKPDEA